MTQCNVCFQTSVHYLFQVVLTAFAPVAYIYMLTWMASVIGNSKAQKLNLHKMIDLSINGHIQIAELFFLSVLLETCVRFSYVLKNRFL